MTCGHIHTYCMHIIYIYTINHTYIIHTYMSCVPKGTFMCTFMCTQLRKTAQSQQWSKR